MKRTRSKKSRDTVPLSLSFIFHVNDQCDHAGSVHIVNNVHGGGGGGGSDHRVHTQWQWPLSGIHYTMMVKSARPGEDGGCTPFPFYCIYHHQVGVYAPAEMADEHPLISPLPLHVLCGSDNGGGDS